MALKLLRCKYGSLGTGVVAKINDLSLDRLESLCEDMMDFVNSQDLDIALPGTVKEKMQDFSTREYDIQAFD